MPSCSNALGSTVSVFCTVGAGLPFLVLLRSAPPGPENRPPSSVSAVPFVAGRLRSNFSSRFFMTRRISPSLSPSVRNSVGLTSRRFSSPIWSRENADAYLSQICGLTPHCKKKSNQSYSGFFVVCAAPDEVSSLRKFLSFLR